MHNGSRSAVAARSCSSAFSDEEVKNSLSYAIIAKTVLEQISFWAVGLISSQKRFHTAQLCKAKLRNPIKCANIL